jgi:hypothetical protein
MSICKFFTRKSECPQNADQKKCSFFEIKEASELQDIAENTYPCKCCGKPIWFGDYCITCEKKRDELMAEEMKQDMIEEKRIEDKEDEGNPHDDGWYQNERH